MSGIGAGGAPLAPGAPVRAAGDVEHGPLVAHEQTQQLDESGAVKPARGAVGGRLNRDGVAHTRDGQPLIEAELSAQHGPRRPSRGGMAEHPEQPGDPLHGAARRAPARVGKHEVGIGSPSHQAEQRFDMRGLDTRVLAHELLEFGELHLHGGREAESFHEQLVGKLGEPVFDGGIQVLDRLEDGERDDAVHHESA